MSMLIKDIISHTPLHQLPIRLTVKLDADDVIYTSHFPGHPITPGACIIQMALELTEKIVGKKMDISEIKNVKFLKILSPIDNPTVDFLFKTLEKSDSEVRVKIEVKDEEKEFSTLSFICR